MSHPILKIFSSSGCQTYLVGCPHTRRCALIDPKVGQEALYRARIADYGLTLALVVDTHTHADHLSASSIFLEEGVPLFMSAATTCARTKRELRAGDEVTVGELTFRVHEVPGHTPDSIALVGHGCAFTGDSLLVGGLARADFVGSDPAQLFDSVEAELLSLPDDTLVFPGHGYNDILFSTIGCERRTNTALQHATGADYAAALGAVPGAGNTPAVDETLARNLEAHPDLPESPATVAACCAAGGGPGRAEVAEVDAAARRDDFEALATRGQWIDVRDPYEFEAGRIPGTVNIPLGELGFHLDELRARGPLTLSCRTGVRSVTAARTLSHLGLEAEQTSLRGGIIEWQDLGYPIEGVPAT
jgi:glyoxylase-like metal-dependent hydrolase (beta-lactamase superfamily II)